MHTSPEKLYAVYFIKCRYERGLEYIGSMYGGRHLDQAARDKDLHIVEEDKDTHHRWRYPKTFIGDKFPDLFSSFRRT